MWSFARDILTARNVDFALEACMASVARDDSFREYFFHCCSDLCRGTHQVC